MDLVLRLAEPDELPDHLDWMIIERDGRRTIAIVDETVSDESLCKLWRKLNPRETHAESA